MAGDLVVISFDEHILEAETADAWLLEIDGRKYWMPKSQCEMDERRKEITAPEWLLEKKDLL